MNTIREAAQARAKHVRELADRPAQRRCGEHPDARGVAVVRSAMSIRALSDAVGSPLHFNGLASATGRGYQMWDMFGPYTESVDPGSFEHTLAQPDLDVPLVLAHDSLRRIARTTNGSLTLSETDDGLDVDAPNLDPRDVDVAYITPKIEAGLVDEMSFAFRIDQGQWSPDFTEYHIQQVDLQRGDVAIVGYGANPYTSASFRKVVDKLEHKRSLDVDDVNVLTQVLGWLSSVDSIVDQAQASLASYLQIPNPDSDPGNCGGACCPPGCTCGDCTACGAVPAEVQEQAAAAVAALRERKVGQTKPAMSLLNLLEV